MRKYGLAFLLTLFLASCSCGPVRVTGMVTAKEYTPAHTHIVCTVQVSGDGSSTTSCAPHYDADV